MVHIPLGDAVGSNSASAGYALTEVRVDGWSRYGLESFQLSWRSHIESLDHVVDESDGQYHSHEYRRRETNHEQRTQNLETTYVRLVYNL